MAPIPTSLATIIKKYIIRVVSTTVLKKKVRTVRFFFLGWFLRRNFAGWFWFLTWWSRRDMRGVWGVWVVYVFLSWSSAKHFHPYWTETPLLTRRLQGLPNVSPLSLHLPSQRQTCLARGPHSLRCCCFLLEFYSLLSLQVKIWKGVKWSLLIFSYRLLHAAKFLPFSARIWLYELLVLSNV